MTKSKPGKYQYFAVGAIGTFMATLDGSILNVSLPTIARDLNCDIDLVAWVVLSYSLTLISLMMLFGAWVDRKGYAFAYRFGYIFFLIGSLMCAFSGSIYALIAARVVQAIGTAMFAAVGPGMVTSVFPPKERGKGIGLMVMMVSAGFMTGPPLGGFILSMWNWNAIFLMNMPIGLLGLWMTWRYFGRLKDNPDGRRVEILTAVTLSLGLVTAIFALSLIDQYELSDPRIWGLCLLSMASIGIFIARETRPGRAMIGFGIFRNRMFSTSLVAQLAHFAGLSGVLVLVPFYLEQVKHLEPSEVGLYLVILPIMMFLIAPLAGRISDRIGYKLLTVSGMAVLAVGLVMLGNLDQASEAQFMASCLVVIGLGVGLFSTPNSSALMGSVSDDQRAVASGILATNRNIGMSVGVAVATALFAHFQKQYLATEEFAQAFVLSLQPVIYFSIALLAIGLIVCLFRPNKFVSAPLVDK